MDNEIADYRRDVTEAMKIRKFDSIKQEQVVSCLAWVMKIASRYRNQGLPLLDLIQEGNLGLLHAVEKFDGSKGALTTYASWWIEQSIKKAIAEQSSVIRMPVAVGESLYRCRRIQRELFYQLNRDPTLEEIAEAMHVSLEKTKELIGYQKRKILGIYEAGDETPEDYLYADESASPEKIAEKKAQIATLQQLLAILTEEERTVIWLLYVEEWMIKDIQKKVQRDSKTIERIRARAMEKMHRAIYFKQIIIS